jgi:hypothetical protein
MLRSLDDMKSHQLLASDGQLGGIKDFLYDDATWHVRFIVVETGNWLTGRKVLVSPSAVEEEDGSRQVMTINLTRKQIEEGPSVDEALPVSRRLEREFALYYGWPAPLQVPWQPIVPIAVPRASREGKQKNPGEPLPTETEIEEDDDHHLRSVDEVLGYHMQATDDDIGHLDDLIVDDRSWNIRYLVVDTRNLLPGKKVLIAPDWVQDISWSDRQVTVDVSRNQVEKSPEFDPGTPINRRVEEQLYDFYGRPVYWEEKKTPAGNASG